MRRQKHEHGRRHHVHQGNHEADAVGKGEPHMKARNATTGPADRKRPNHERQDARGGQERREQLDLAARGAQDPLGDHRRTHDRQQECARDH